MAAFGGFGSFDVYERIWDGVFQKNHQLLRTVLSHTDPEILDDFTLSKKLNCTVAWTWERDCILKYRNSEKDYRQIWLNNIPTHPNYEELFEDFCQSVPSKTDKWSDRYLSSAKEVRDYLTKLLPHCKPEAKVYGIAAAAGLYALVCFFMQNQRNIKDGRILCVPPAKYNPVAVTNDEKEDTKAAEHTEGNPAGANAGTSAGASETQDVVRLPSGALHAPDATLSFDLFECVNQFFQENIPAHTKYLQRIHASTKNTLAEFCSVITPAEIHRKMIPCSEAIEDDNIENVHSKWSGFFLIEDILLFHSDDASWNLRHKLAPIPYETKGRQKQLVVNAMRFEDNTGYECAYAIWGDTLWMGSSLYSITGTRPSRFTESGIVPTRYIAYETMQYCLSIDENGHRRDYGMENLLSSYHLKALPQDGFRSSSQRAATAYCKQEYLNFQFFNAETMEEIPINIVKDQTDGTYLVSITVPCPCSLFIVRNSVTKLSWEDALRLIVSGYLHGAYGMETEPDKAIDIMEGNATPRNPQMAFQYGAYLRCKKDMHGAESYLRIAAKENVPGAQFELAELLKDRGTPQAVAEAQQLIDSLWFRGYRTYGATQSIDLFGEHTQSN